MRDMGCLEEWKPIFMMLAVGIAYAVMNTMIKKVLDEGMSRLVFITYRQLVATLFMAPVAYFAERKTRPKLTTKIFVYLFFSSLLGASLTQYLFFVGLQYTSATFACAFLNMTPVFTFLVAIPLRLEKVNVTSKAGIAKVLGTVVCLVGAMLLTLYKGITLTNTSNQTVSEEHESRHVGTHSRGKWLLASTALLAGTFSWSAWFLLQTKISKKYPALYSGTALIFFLSFLQAATLSVSIERGMPIWALKGNLEILTVIYSGAVGSGFGFLATSWCVAKRGPVFTAAFTPLVQIFVAIIDVSIIHSQLHLGSVVGSILVISGLYFLLWGKSKDVTSNIPVKQSEAINERIPEPVSAV